MRRTPQEQLEHFLSDMYSVELQALAQLVSAPKIAGEPTLAAYYEQHHAETEQQAELVRARLEAHGGSPSTIKDAIMKLGGKSFLLFARVQPETPGRLHAHSYSYEAMEWAGYQMLIRMAEQAGDAATTEAAQAIAEQERAMMERLEDGFDAAVTASHGNTPSTKLSEEIRKHLAEAHALETQSLQLLKKSEQVGGDSELDQLYAAHLSETYGHARMIDMRLEALGSGVSSTKDAALALGGLNWGLFFQAQSDTPAKLAAFIYAVEHLEIAGYELLRRTARLGHDFETERLCEQILAEERAMVERLVHTFDAAVISTLEAVSS